MSALFSLFVAFMAFVGAIVGHYVAFHLNTAATRREVRRTRIERLAELLSEDAAWLDQCRDRKLHGVGASPIKEATFSKARAIAHLYFVAELGQPFAAYLKARGEYEGAINDAYLARLQAAQQVNATDLEGVSAPQDKVDAVTATLTVYFESLDRCFAAASTVVEETIPEGVPLGKVCASAFDKIAIWRRVG